VAASFVLTLDTAPPASPQMLINGGSDRASDPVVTVRLLTPSTDVREAKVWGDVDPAADPRFQHSEADSDWVLWSPEIDVRLAAGTGRKYLYARLKDDVCNETVAFADWIDLDTDSPAVSVTDPVDRGRISAHDDDCGTAHFSWTANQSFSHYEVRVVPTTGSPHTAGSPIPATGGSLNVSGDGTFTSGSPITTTVRGADLRAASPGDGPKVVKVFVRNGAGAWSA
jgi:hypothetical protein